MSETKEQALIDAAIARFPATFGLRGFPGSLFRISRDASYMASGNGFPVSGPVDHPTYVVLYTQTERDGQWYDFAKGTEEELRREVLPLTVRVDAVRASAYFPNLNAALLIRSDRIEACVDEEIRAALRKGYQLDPHDVREYLLCMAQEVLDNDDEHSDETIGRARAWLGVP